MSWPGGGSTEVWAMLSPSSLHPMPSPCVGTATAHGLTELIKQVHYTEKRHCQTLCHLVFFSSWFGPSFTQGTDGKCSQTLEWELLQPPGEFKKPEGNLNRVIQRDTSKVMFQCRVNHEALMYLCVYITKKREKINTYKSQNH